MRKVIGTLMAMVVGLVGVVAISAPASARAPDVRINSIKFGVFAADQSLGREWIELINRGPEAVNLRGFTVQNGSGANYGFNGDVMIAGQGGRLWLHAGTGVDTDVSRYWQNGNFVWDDAADQATLRSRQGFVTHTCTYADMGDGRFKRCPVIT